jgi:uncharacterized protein
VRLQQDGRVRLSASDLSNYLECRHQTRLDLLVSRGELREPSGFDLGFEDLVARGEAHEQRVLEELTAAGQTVAIIPGFDGGSPEERAQATRDAIRSGVDVISQGVLLLDTSRGLRLYGQPDFLLRVVVGEPGRAARYEVVDAKLARTAKARAVLQSAFYSALLAEVQGTAPERLHLALGNGEMASFRVADVAAYERRIRASLEEFVGQDPGTYPTVEPYPEPVEHCAICRWSDTCETKRRADDDLSLVAGMPTTQRVALKGVGVHARRTFAALDTLPDVKGVNAEVLRRAQLQAQLQVASEDLGRIQHERLPLERDADGAIVPDRGLLALPEPAVGDLFFDIEGARFYSEDDKEFGLQYLFGIVDTADLDENGKPRYTQIWAFDRADEKTAFEELIDFITLRREVHPGLHVYHYNHYEPTSVDHLTELHETREEAVGRLMGRFASREDDVDELFRRGVFVDLYRVVRQGLRVGVESYSIKRLEPLVGYTRAVDLPDATRHLIAFEEALDTGEARVDEPTRTVVAGYNEDDCRATLVLREWLEGQRVELAREAGAVLPRPVANEREAEKTDPAVILLKARLRHGLSAEPEKWSDEEKARALLADLLEWHRREEKPGWWRYFAIRRMSPGQLVDEPDAIGELRVLGGGEPVGMAKKSTVFRFGFPPQEHGFKEGERVEDPVSTRTWTVEALDEDAGTIDLKILVKDAVPPMPSAIVEGAPVLGREQEARLRDYAETVVSSGFAPGAASALLLRRRPQDGRLPVPGESLRQTGEAASDAAVRISLVMHGSSLSIQGPPGAGKTFTAARAILDLIGQGRTVGITAPSHAVNCNLLDEVTRQAAARGVDVRIGQKPDPERHFLHDDAQSLDYDALEAKLQAKELDIVAGTTWLWARPQFAGSVDTLVVDEAGQLSLANVLAVCGAASNVVLLGDPQQLAQPSQAAHPPGAGVSALEHVLGDRDTMPVDAGIFLDRTWRMHPALCRYTSDLFYDGRLEGVDGLERQNVGGAPWDLAGSGLQFVPVPHEGNANASPEEADAVVGLVRRLLGSEWTGKEGPARSMTPADVLVVTPFNAQVREIDRQLADAGLAGVRVGTVDKFQGREAPAVLYSMASSSAADAPRGLEFLFDLHRLNVATSRARGVALIVASPDLLRVFCRTPRQMVLANALCRAQELQSPETP